MNDTGSAAGPELKASVRRLIDQRVFATAVSRTRMAMVLADPGQPDCPLVFVNPAFERLTGYSQDEVVGRNCRFLQGPKTDRAAVDRISRAVAERRDIEEEIYNYRRDGSGFWNALYLSPVFDDDGRLIYFFASQLDVTARRAMIERQSVLVAELQHRTRNLMNVIQALTQQTLRGSTSLDDFATTFEGRIGALARSQTMLARGGTEAIDLHDLVTMELAAHGAPAGAAVSIEGPPVELPVSALQILALALHELATNAVKHGALGPNGGRIAVNWRIEGGGRGVLLEWRESGVMLPPKGAAMRRGYGTELIERALPHQLGAETSLNQGPDGVRCSILLPFTRPAPGSFHA